MTENNKSWQEKLNKTAKRPENNQNSAQNQENISNNPENEVNQDQQNQPKKSENEILQEKLIAEQQKSSQLNDKLLRSLAEIENIRRRSKEDIEKANNYAISNFVSDLSVVAENFFLACDNMPKEEMESSQKVKNFAIGVDMTKKELIKIFEKNKVTRIFPLNQDFDHNLHEAVSQSESEGEENKVLQVIQAGYKIGDRIIRPALVVVSKKKSDQ